MEELKKLQEEFEELIAELERLKTINEITEDNTRNARKTIQEIQAMVEAFSVFKEKVEQDFGQKSETLSKLQVAFKSSIDSLENTISKQSGRFEKIAIENNTKSTEAISAFKVEASQEIGELNSSLAGLLEKQAKELTDSLSKIKAASKTSADETIKELSSIRSENQKSKNEIGHQITSLNDEVNSNFKAVKNWVIFILVLISILGVAIISLLLKSGG